MRLFWALAVTIAGWMPLDAAYGFDRCGTFYAAPGVLRALLVDKVVRNTPMKYFAQANAIRLEIDSQSGLIPHATFDPDAVVVFSPAFPPLLCRLALATFLELLDKIEPMKQASHAAYDCRASTRQFDDCLVKYGNDLERLYRADFTALNQHLQHNAYEIALDALVQVGRHEYAHHLLRHRDRNTSGELARIDAEFEADFYAVQNGVQTGEPPPAMFYFFEPMARMEGALAESTPDYESSRCRATNADDITGVFGLAPELLLRVVRGEAQPSNAYSDLRKIAAELARKPPPSPNPQSCGRLAASVLRQAHGELTTLTALVAESADLLKPSPATGDPYNGLGLNSPEVFQLIGRLRSTSQSFIQLKGLATRVLSFLVRRVDLVGLEDKIADSLDQMVTAASDDILAADYGRILAVEADRILFHARQRPLAARLDAAQLLYERALSLLPAMEAGWLGLTSIAFARGDCGKAAKLAERAVTTADEGKSRDAAVSLRDRLREDASGGHCAEAVARANAGLVQ